MKTINSITRFTVLLTLFLSISFVSCKKTTVSPTGPQGATGAQGPAGPQGNANVKSIIFSTGYNWKADSTGKKFSYRYFTADLNTSVLQNGLVMLYVSEDQGSNGTEWKAMPFSGRDIDFSFKVELSAVEIFVSSSTGLMPSNPGNQKFKLSIIPPAN